MPKENFYRAEFQLMYHERNQKMPMQLEVLHRTGGLPERTKLLAAQTLDCRWRHQKWKFRKVRKMKQTTRFVALFLILAGSVSGCGNPCNELYDKVCSDLGDDCSVFSSNPSIQNSILPKQAVVRKSEIAQCEMHLDDENYAGYTLPYVQNQIAKLKDPNAPQQALAEIKMVDGVFSGFSSSFLYVLPIFVILGMFLYMRWYKKKVMEAQK